MPLSDRIQSQFQACAQTCLDAAVVLSPAIEAAARLIVQTIAQGGKLMVAAEGQATARGQHLVSLLMSRFEHERPALPAISLTADAGTLLAIVNEAGADALFARQIRALGQPGDALVLVSDCAHAVALEQAVDAAHARGMGVVALVGQTGGSIAERLSEADVLLTVPADSLARILETHFVCIHSLCDAVDSILLGVEE